MSHDRKTYRGIVPRSFRYKLEVSKTLESLTALTKTFKRTLQVFATR